MDRVRQLQLANVATASYNLRHGAIQKRARQLLRDFDNERHGEDDDPEEGGEG